MKTATAVIAEDEPLLRAELRAALARLWPELAIVAEAADGPAALAALLQHAPTVLFLDIEMPGLSGLDVARAASGRCHVVFVTAYDHHAIDAFASGAVDYVLKPLALDRLAITVSRLRERADALPPALTALLDRVARGAAPRPWLRWVQATQGTRIQLFATDEICYFAAQDKYTSVVTPDTEALIRMSIRELREALDPDTFWQIHRGTIVNAHAIAGVERDARGRLHVRLKARPEPLAVSDAHAARFRAR
ncbi:MAG: response regulator transcription factor [Proteobacteria bacterium]|nr:response regulator transcription factor [Pseudomonadota bacterium]